MSTPRSWWGRRTLRGRLAMLSAVAVIAAIASASGLAYFATAHALRGQIDDALTNGPPNSTTFTHGDRARRPADAPFALTDPERLCASTVDAAAQFRAVVGTVELIRADGSTCVPDGSKPVVPQPQDVAAANGGPATAVRDDITSSGTHVRVRTSPLDASHAILVARDLTDVDATLLRLGVDLIVATATGALLAMAAGLFVARTGLRPIADLTRAAEHIAATHDLTGPIDIHGDDEVARLARAFNAMTSALAAAGERQQQLVADASHELRTPLTSLRTNIELLVRSEHSGRALSPADRRALLEGVSAQLVELSDLVTELTVLSHQDPVPEPVAFRLDDVVRRAVERAGRRGDHVLTVDLEAWEIVGDPAAVERAVLNVLDNAIKFSPRESTVRIGLTRGVLTVADSGPGILAAEQDRVFDRFWRSPTARPLPGSGLGLAIVADVIARHGGTVSASSAPDGGAVISLKLPGTVPEVLPGGLPRVR